MDDTDFTPPVAPTPIVYCRHCRFWDAHLINRPTQTPEGLCRRHAPHPSMLNEEIDAGTSWPRTFDDDWCADGKPYDPA